MTPWSLRLLRPLEFIPLADGKVSLRDPSRDLWAKTVPWTRPILDALAAGATGADAVAGALAREDSPGERAARRFLLSLEKVGYLAIEVPAPERLAGLAVVRELGRGGVGVAYLCERGTGERLVAKVPWDFLYAMEVVEKALRREAEVHALLNHPAIVKGLGLIEDGGAPVVLRAHVEGEDLRRVHDGRPADRKNASRLAGQIGEIMAHLHERGLLLIDYKPSNFLVAHGVLRLLDVGHCRPPGSRRVGGTPGFMPPEIARGEAAQIGSDIWGLGRLYAFLRAGRLPPRRSRDESPLNGVPDDAIDAVAALCHEDPQARPRTLREAVARIEQS